MDSLSAYCVIGSNKEVAAKPVCVTDTFSAAVEAAEVNAQQACLDYLENRGKKEKLAAAKETIAKKTPIVSFLTEETEEPPAGGFYGRWSKFDEGSGVATLDVFEVNVKPDGYLISGSRKTREVVQVLVQPIDVDLFSGIYAPKGRCCSADELSSIGGDEDASDDETYCDNYNY